MPSRVNSPAFAFPHAKPQSALEHGAPFDFPCRTIGETVKQPARNGHTTRLTLADRQSLICQRWRASMATAGGLLSSSNGNRHSGPCSATAGTAGRSFTETTQARCGATAGPMAGRYPGRTAGARSNKARPHASAIDETTYQHRPGAMRGASGDIGIPILGRKSKIPEISTALRAIERLVPHFTYCAYINNINDLGSRGARPAWTTRARAVVKLSRHHAHDGRLKILLGFLPCPIVFSIDDSIMNR
jgi:hypothetical protein